VAKILLVDDSLFARMNIGAVLKKIGHEVLEAENGLQGLEMVKKHSPDCILSDLLMPEMDGLTFLKTLRESGCRRPVIILTADIQETKKQECEAYGAAEFLCKPPKREELLKMLDRILEPSGEGK